MKSARVLVTGSNGFLGRHVVNLLAEHSYRVSTLGRKKSIHNFPHTKVNLVNNLPDKAIKNVDAVIHLASEVNIASSIENPSLHIDNNLSMTFNILNTCKKLPKKPLVIFLSTDRVYGKARGRVTEKSTTFPIEPYTASKIMGETVLSTYANLFDIPYIIIRTSAFFGPYQPRRSFISDVIQKMIAGENITVGPLKSVKNFTYVGNVASAVLAALRAPNSARNCIYNIGGKPRSLLEILNICKYNLENRLGKKIKIHIDRSIRLPSKNEIGAFSLSTLSARNALSWKESVTLQEGLEYTVDYFLKNK
jgi:nucleoside-diphosphate-sugar epimerase